MTPELVRRLHRLTQPGPGERRLRDPQGSRCAEKLRHGASTKASQEVSCCPDHDHLQASSVITAGWSAVESCPKDHVHTETAATTGASVQ